MSVFEIIFITILGFSILSNFLSIPGNFIIFFDAVWYGLVTDFNKLSISFLITLLIIAIGIELLEYIIIAFGARRYGASRLGVVAAILGGLGGSISGFFVSPVLGAIVGGFIGVIAGTLAIELFRGNSMQIGIRATLGAILGRVGGLTIKAIGTVTMVVIVASRLFFL